MMRLRILIVASAAIFGCLTIMQAQRGYMPFNDDDSPAPLPPDATESDLAGTTVRDAAGEQDHAGAGAEAR